MFLEIATNPLGQRLWVGMTAVKTLSGHSCLVFCDMHQVDSVLFYFLNAEKLEGRDEFIGLTHTLNRGRDGHTQLI